MVGLPSRIMPSHLLASSHASFHRAYTLFPYLTYNTCLYFLIKRWLRRPGLPCAAFWIHRIPLWRAGFYQFGSLPAACLLLVGCLPSLGGGRAACRTRGSCHCLLRTRCAPLRWAQRTLQTAFCFAALLFFTFILPLVLAQLRTAAVSACCLTTFTFSWFVRTGRISGTDAVPGRFALWTLPPYNARGRFVLCCWERSGRRLALFRFLPPA